MACRLQQHIVHRCGSILKNKNSPPLASLIVILTSTVIPAKAGIGNANWNPDSLFQGKDRTLSHVISTVAAAKWRDLPHPPRKSLHSIPLRSITVETTTRTYGNNKKTRLFVSFFYSPHVTSSLFPCSRIGIRTSSTPFFKVAFA